MAAMQNVEAEAAKFLQKLIQESKDEPAKLATKLYVILQHMKASGKENSMPYQVISRAMETVINDHDLDIEALKSSRLPISGGSQIGDSSQAQSAGCSQTTGVANESTPGLKESNLTRIDVLSSSLPPAGPYGTGHPYQVPASHRSGKSFDHESPSSLDTRSADSHSHEWHDRGSREQQANTKETKKTNAKRKRSGSTSAVEPPTNNSQRLEAHGQGADTRQGKLLNKMESPGSFPGPAGKFQAGNPGAAGPYAVVGGFSGAPSLDPSGKGPVDSEYWKPGLKGGNVNFPERAGQGHGFSTQPGEEAMSNTNLASRTIFENPGGFPNISTSSDRVVQGPTSNTLNEMSMLRSAASGDSGKSVMSPVPSASGMPFKEHHLKQLRAQCLVFLAFRNGIMPKRMHLEIALGSNLSTEGAGNSLDGAYRESMDNRGAEHTMSEPNSTRQEEMIRGSRKNSVNDDRKTYLTPARRVMENEFQSQEALGSSAFMARPSQPDNSNFGSPGLNNQETVSGGHNEASRESLPASADSIHKTDGSPNHFQHSGNRGHLPTESHLLTPLRPISGLDTEQQKIMPANDANTLLGHAPKEHTTSEYWIMVHQKRRLVSRQNWVKKQEKANQSIRARYNELKETVSSSEDISAKTKSVIELKKLQLIELQRRLRSNLMNDFFKVIKPEIDYLKGIKKHRIGRRLKQVEKYEQRMKEERQKRIRERQKEFFSEIEVHKDRLEDLFKFKRERGRGFNKFIKEFHKKKERTHREKIDRIQREKINLLKINDVEGYLRMVQDAKSDRVKQLLKETEKYLQKLGSKLQEAKTVARLFEAEMDEGSSTVYECSFIGTETEDENDQAKHYKESNEKYYMIAHSIKENITEQPTSLRGGKLREYQMNGLRWLVSLYNNHLNGILADEMGLGKTVQVIALLCYLMEAKNDRGPFLVVVPSSVLPGWETEINFWAPGINKIVYSGPPEERRKLFKERIIHQKFNVLLTTYEYLMNKHDRPKLSKVHWHYIIIDEGHRIKNASCKLNADLKYYHSSHRLLLTGTPLQNNLEELWALLNFLLPNIFNSSEDFSQWFNKPFESNGDNSPDQALLSEEENLLIINRLHQVLRPFVLRRLKHKVENELPEKIERLVRCEASAYQKLLMKRVEENLGPLGSTKVRSVHNSVIELRNICNHPYLSQLHTDEVDALIPKHFLPPIIRLCGKLEMLDRLLPKLKATNHRILFFSTMTRLLDVMEEYLVGKKYAYLRLDGHTSGSDRGALIEKFNDPESPFFIFLLSIRAGGVGVNLQAADTVIIFDTDWNPQVDLQAQARAHRIGQKKDVLVLRLETINSVEEQVRAAAEHKLGVANQSITAGFFDNNTSAEDRREYLESLLRECKKEEAAPVLNDDGLNDLLARSESEIEVFESIDHKRQEEEMEAWKMLMEQGIKDSDNALPLPPRLVTDEELKPFYEAMRIYEAQTVTVPNASTKRKSGYLGGLDTQQYGRGKRAREVRSYEEQWNEDEFDKICQDDFPGTLKPKQEIKDVLPTTGASAGKNEPVSQPQVPLTSDPSLVKQEITPPVKRGRGRPRRAPAVASPSAVAHPYPTAVNPQAPITSSNDLRMTPQTTSTTVTPSTGTSPSVAAEPVGKSSKEKGATDTGRPRGRKAYKNSPVPMGPVANSPESRVGQHQGAMSSASTRLAVQNPQSSGAPAIDVSSSVPSILAAQSAPVGDCPVKEALALASSQTGAASGNMVSNSKTTVPLTVNPSTALPPETLGRSPKGKGSAETGHRRGRKPNKNSLSLPAGSAVQALKSGDQQVTFASPSLPSGLAVQNIQLTVQPGTHTSPSVPSVVAQSSLSSEHPVKETLPAFPAGSAVAISKEVDRQVAASVAAGVGAQGSDLNDLTVKQASTAPSGLTVQGAESSQQLAKQASASVASCIAVQEPKSRKRKTKPLSTDTSSPAVVPRVAADAQNLLSQGPVVSVIPSSGVSAAAVVFPDSAPHFGGPSNAMATADSQHMLHGRQIKKSQSVAEPARRRGRKPAQSTSAAPIESIVQDSGVPPPVAVFLGAPGTANLGMGSKTAAIPVIPLVPVSGLVPGSNAAKDPSVSVHHLSAGFSLTSNSVPQSSSAAGAQADPSIKTEGPTQKSSIGETNPRRRGRKTAPVTPAGDFSEGKHTRLDLEAASPTKEAKTSMEDKVSPPNMSMPSGSSVHEEYASKKADEMDKPLETVKDQSAADVLLMSSTLNVVASRIPDFIKKPLVLALRTAFPVAYPTGQKSMSGLGIEECLDSQECEPRKATPLSLGASEPVGDPMSDIAAISELYDEMSAPPGFDIPRARLDAPVQTSLGGEDAQSRGKASALHEDICMTKKRLTLGANEALMDPTDFIDEDSVPPGFDVDQSCSSAARISKSLQTMPKDSSFEPAVSKVETGSSNRTDSGGLVDEDSVPPGFEPQSVPVEDKNESAEISVSCTKVSVKDNEGQNSGDGSHDICHSAETSLAVEDLVVKHTTETKDDDYNLQKDDEPIQAMDLGSEREADISMPEVGASSTSCQGSLMVDSLENTGVSNVGKKDDSSTLFPPDPLHLPDASTLAQENTLQATSAKSSREQIEPKIETSSSSLSDSNVAADTSNRDVQSKASCEKPLNSDVEPVCSEAVEASCSVLEDLADNRAKETKDGCNFRGDKNPTQAKDLGTVHELDIGEPEIGLSSDESVKLGSEVDTTHDVGKNGDCSSKFSPETGLPDAALLFEQKSTHNAMPVESFMEQSEHTIRSSSTSLADSDALVDASIDVQTKGSCEKHSSSGDEVSNYRLDAADASGSGLISGHDEKPHVIDVGESKSEELDPSTQISGEVGDLMELDQKDDFVVGNSMCATSSIENVSQPVEPVPESQIDEVSSEDASNPEACQEVSGISHSPVENVLRLPSLRTNEELPTEKLKHEIDVSVMPDENTGGIGQISTLGSCDPGSMAKDTETPLSKSDCSRQLDSVLSGAASSENQEEASHCPVQQLPSTDLSLDTVEVPRTEPEENADVATIVAPEACGITMSCSEDAELSQHPSLEASADKAGMVTSKAVTYDDQMMVAECSMQPDAANVFVSGIFTQASLLNRGEAEETCKVDDSASLRNSGEDMVKPVLESQTSIVEEKKESGEVFEKDEDPIQTKDPQTEHKVDIGEPKIAVPSTHSDVTLKSGLEENTGVLDTGKEVDCAFKVLPHTLHLPGSAIDLEEEKACEATSLESFVEQAVLAATMITSSISVADSYAVVDASICGMQSKTASGKQPNFAVESSSFSTEAADPSGPVLVSRHEEKSQDVDVGENKSDKSDPSTQLIGGKGGPVELDADDDSALEKSMHAAESIENVTEPTEPVPKNQIGEVNSEDALMPEALQEGNIAESLVETGPELQSQQSEELSIEQARAAIQVDIFGIEPEEDVDAASMLAPEACVDTSSKPEDAVVMVVSDAVSGDDPMAGVECSMQPVSETSIDVAVTGPSHGDSDAVMAEVGCSRRPMFEKLKDVIVVDPSHCVSGDDRIVEGEFSVQRLLETSSNAADVEPSHGVAGDDDVGEAECSMPSVLEASTNAAVVEPSNGVSGDDGMVKAESSEQPMLKKPSDATEEEPSHGVSGDGHAEEAECPTQTVLETSGSAAVVELSPGVSVDDPMVEVESSKQPLLETPSNVACAEPSNSVAGDDHAEKAVCPIQPVLETSTDYVDVEPCNGVTGDSHPKEADHPMEPLLGISGDATAAESSHGVSGDAQMVEAKSSVLETSTDSVGVEPSNGVTNDNHAVEADCPIEPVLRLSGDAAVAEPSHGVCGNDRLAEVESLMQPMLETSCDAPVVEPSPVDSDDDHMEEENCSMQPVLEISSHAADVEPSQGASGDDHMQEAAVETSSDAVDVEPSHGVTGDDHTEDAECPMPPVVETSGDAAVEPADGGSGGDHMAEDESSMQPEFETSRKAAVAEPSYIVSADEHGEETNCSMQTVLDTSKDVVDVEPLHAVSSDDRVVEAESSWQPVLETSTAAAVVVPIHGVSDDDQMVDAGVAEQPMLETPCNAAAVEPSDVVPGDDHLGKAACSVQPVSETSINAAIAEPSCDVSGDDQMVETEVPVQPMSETSSDAAPVEPSHVVSGDDCTVGAKLKVTSGPTIAKPSLVDSREEQSHVADCSGSNIDGSKDEVQHKPNVAELSFLPEGAKAEAHTTELSILPEGANDKADSSLVFEGSVDHSSSVADHLEDKSQPDSSQASNEHLDSSQASNLEQPESSQAPNLEQPDSSHVTSGADP